MKDSIQIRFRIHYIPMLVVSIIFCFIFYVFRSPPLTTIPFITYTSGYLSIFLIALSMLLGPVNLILKQKNPISSYIRRDIGIFGGILGIVHSVVGLFMHFTGKPWLYFVKEVEDGFSIRFGNFGLANYTGLLGFLILIFLLFISNDHFLVKYKAVKWKNLQRFTYPLFLLVIAHSVFYRLNAEKEDLILYLYLPLFSVILISQFIGIWLKVKE